MRSLYVAGAGLKGTPPWDSIPHRWEGGDITPPLYVEQGESYVAVRLSNQGHHTDVSGSAFSGIVKTLNCFSWNRENVKLFSCLRLARSHARKGLYYC